MACLVEAQLTYLLGASELSHVVEGFREFARPNGLSDWFWYFYLMKVSDQRSIGGDQGDNYQVNDR